MKRQRRDRLPRLEVIRRLNRQRQRAERGLLDSYDSAAATVQELRMDDERFSEELDPIADADIIAARQILARVAVLLRQGKVAEALAEIPYTEHEAFAERVLGDELPPRLGHYWATADRDSGYFALRQNISF